jgi:hypothetical protein
VKVFVESGAKRVFAGAVEWPGLARSGKTEEESLARLLEYVPRYKRSLAKAADTLDVPRGAAGLKVIARLTGGSGTDFGVPSAVADFDRVTPTSPALEAQLDRLRGAWRAFDKAARSAEGKTLASGPRGGGRDLAKMREHVLEADRAYISSLGAKAPPASAERSEVQHAFIEALQAKLRGELPEVGPRGGERWPALYAIRRSAWHALDHAWEIDDRLA